MSEQQPESTPQLTISIERARLEKGFIRAVKQGDAATVAALLKVWPELVKLRDAEEATPLHYAAWKGHRAVAELLLEAGAELDAASINEHYGGTPLHAAAHGDQRELVQLLLERGADVHFRSANGRTPLDETAFHKATAAAKLLRAGGATE